LIPYTWLFHPAYVLNYNNLHYFSIQETRQSSHSASSDSSTKEKERLKHKKALEEKNKVLKNIRQQKMKELQRADTLLKGIM
jgi:hypothetical protein